MWFWNVSVWKNIFRRPARSDGPPPPAGRDALGLYGEAAAERYLASTGCDLLARRWRPKQRIQGEIDLVVREGREIVFVEVKTRRSGDFGWPEEAVTAFKRGQLRRLAAAYLAETGQRRRPYRIDVIAVTMPTVAGARVRLRHIRSAVAEAELETGIRD